MSKIGMLTGLLNDRFVVFALILTACTLVFGGIAWLLDRPRLRIPRARGRALTGLALDRFNLQREGRWERLPWLGDVFFRRRVDAAMRLASLPAGTRAWLEEAQRVARYAGISAADFEQRQREIARAGMPVGAFTGGRL